MNFRERESYITVLTIINGFELGGIEKTFSLCLPYLENKKIKIEICCFTKQGVLLNSFEDFGIKIHKIKKTRSIFLDFIQLLLLTKKVRPALIHSRLGFTSGGFCLASRLLRIPFILSLHSTKATIPSGLEKAPIFGSLIELQLKFHRYITYTFSNLIIGHSKANLNAYFKNLKRSDNVRLVYNGIEINQNKIDNAAHLRKGADICILHIGSFREPKNHEFLIKSFMKLNPIANNYRLIMLGEGMLWSSIMKMVNKNGLNTCVEMPGLVQGLDEYFAAADLFYFPSKYEGFGNVVIEAQEKGLPVCGSNIPALYESLLPAYHNYLFDPNNVFEAVSSLKRMIEAIKRKELQLEIKNAKQFVQDNFSIKYMADNLAICYEELVQKE